MSDEEPKTNPFGGGGGGGNSTPSAEEVTESLSVASDDVEFNGIASGIDPNMVYYTSRVRGLFIAGVQFKNGIVAITPDEAARFESMLPKFKPRHRAGILRVNDSKEIRAKIEAARKAQGELTSGVLSSKDPTPGS